MALVGTDLYITGVIDGPIFGGVPKAIELFACSDVPDLSEYCLTSPNNGAATPPTCTEYPLPSGSLSAGDFIYVAKESPQFDTFLGFPPNYLNDVANLNGDDAFVLFRSGSIVDRFGAEATDGTGEPWEYMDGWAYRVGGTAASPSFSVADWTYSGPNALDNELTNAGAASPFPIGSYSSASCGGGGGGGGACLVPTDCGTVSAGDLPWKCASGACVQGGCASHSECQVFGPALYCDDDGNPGTDDPCQEMASCVVSRDTLRDGVSPPEPTANGDISDIPDCFWDLDQDANDRCIFGDAHTPGGQCYPPCDGSGGCWIGSVCLNNYCVPDSNAADNWGLEFDHDSPQVSASDAKITATLNMLTGVDAKTGGAVIATILSPDCDKDNLIAALSPAAVTRLDVDPADGIDDVKYGLHVSQVEVELDAYTLVNGNYAGATGTADPVWVPADGAGSATETSKGTGTICVRTDLRVTSGQLVSFRTVRLGIFVDLTANEFEITSQAMGLVTEDAGTDDISDEFECLACFCSGTGSPVCNAPPADQTLTLVQNAAVRVCVYAESDDTYISNFDMFMWQAGNLDSSKAGPTNPADPADGSNAIHLVDNNNANYAVTNVYNDGDANNEFGIYMVETRLWGVFFDWDPTSAGYTPPNFPPIQFGGVCDLSFRTARRLLLEGGAGPGTARLLQRGGATEIAGSSRFDLELGVVAAEDGFDLAEEDDHEREAHAGGEQHHGELAKDEASGAIVAATDENGATALSVGRGLLVSILAAALAF